MRRCCKAPPPPLSVQLDAAYASTADYVKLHILGFEETRAPGEEEEGTVVVEMWFLIGVSWKIILPSPFSPQTAAKPRARPRPTRTPTSCGV